MRQRIRKVLLWIPFVNGFIGTREEHGGRQDFKLALGLTFLMLLAAGAVLYALLRLVYLICLDIGIHFIGVYMMLAAAALAGFSSAIAKKIHPRRGRKRREIARNMRIISIIICAGGLLLAILLG